MPQHTHNIFLQVSTSFKGSFNPTTMNCFQCGWVSIIVLQLTSDDLTRKVDSINMKELMISLLCWTNVGQKLKQTLKSLERALNYSVFNRRSGKKMTIIALKGILDSCRINDILLMITHNLWTASSKSLRIQAEVTLFYN